MKGLRCWPKRIYDGSLGCQEEERKGCRRRGTVSYRAGEVEEESSPPHKWVPERVLYLLSSCYASNNLGQTGFCLGFLGGWVFLFFGVFLYIHPHNPW